MRALSVYKSKSLIVLSDIMGVLSLLNRKLSPYMESLALTLGNNFQLWALTSYKEAMRTLELELVGITAAAHVNLKEDCNLIVCCADLLNGILHTLLLASNIGDPDERICVARRFSQPLSRGDGTDFTHVPTGGDPLCANFVVNNDTTLILDDHPWIVRSTPDQ